jgi:hypothetical protein
MNFRVVVRLCVVGLAFSALPVKGQDLSLRLSQMRADAALRQIAAELPSSPSGAPDVAPTDIYSAPKPRRQITASLDGRVGFDRQTVIFTSGAGTARRRIATFNLSLAYPLSPSTSVFVSVPYIEQRETLNSALGTLRLRGRGLGDVGFYIQRNFPEVAKGTDVTVSLGLITPTGKDPFSIAPDRLPTGLGFYQPVTRVTVRKLRVPLQLYAAVDYGTSFKRNIGGTRVNLPDSYGGELGFYYTIGPEFISQTSVSVSKVSSPFIDVPGATVGYLSQALTYQANQRTSLRASVDVGLTEDSTDAFAGLSLSSNF